MFEYRRLGKFTFHVITNKSKIKPFLVKWLDKEWQQDHKEYPDQIWIVDWLNLLASMKFHLEVIELGSIKLREDLMNYKNESYSFLGELKSRVDEMEEAILQGSSIGPLIVNKENMELMDGYTRYMILKKNGAKEVYVYIGSVEK
ncbi:MAG: hypothetical protein ACFFEN_08635 [Candidatus Thorarchaeota archaeon]